jgi:hypothetical protein
MAELYGSVRTTVRLLSEVESMLKHPSVAVELGRQGVNVSLAILGVQGLVAYIEGNRARALDDFSTLAEEIRTRLVRP